MAESKAMIAVEIVDAVIRGNRIKKVLEDKGITQEEAARRVGISYRHFNRIVLNRSEPSLMLTLRMVEVFDEPIERLFDIRIKTRRRSTPTRAVA